MPPLTLPDPDSSTLKLLAALPPEKREALIAAAAEEAGLSPELFKTRLLWDWRIVGRPKQQPPPGSWAYWLLNAGRGFGKTLTGAQWTKKKAAEFAGCRIGLIAPTMADVRDTMVEGETGLLSVLPEEMLRGGSRDSAWNRSLLELDLANGTHMKGFSSEKPARLRGPQHHFVWAEEVSSWQDARAGIALDTTFSNMTLGLRLGEQPQACMTTTPKANKLTKAILALGAALVITRGSSYENRDNLAEAWWRQVVEPLEGTRTGRQEIMAELLEDVEGALWTAAQLDDLRVAAAPPLMRVVVAVDPNVSSGEAANDAGVIVAGRSAPRRANPSDLHETPRPHAYVIADRTTTSGGPRAWARAAVEAYYEFECDRIIAEKNNGGEMVEITIHTVDPSVPVKLVSASRGKRTRAEPVSALYEGDVEKQNPPRAHHVGAFPELEEEMTTWVPDPGEESPNRMDALVWALSELMQGATNTMKSSVPKGRIPGVGERMREIVPGGR